LVGDFNAYAKEDPIETLLAGGFSSIIDLDDEETPYGYVFDGQFGTLDYALIKDVAACKAAAAEWHVNSDEPDIYDYNVEIVNNVFRDSKIYDPTTAIRYSDHDPVLIGLNYDDECKTPKIEKGMKGSKKRSLRTSGGTKIAKSSKGKKCKTPKSRRKR
jgi:predicted extracellular nuclease